MTSVYDAVVIGAGMAGLAVGAELASGRRVLVMDRQPGHATQSSARSASSWIAGYGRPAVTPLTLASRSWYEEGGGGYVDHSLLSRRGVLLVSANPESPGLAASQVSGSRVIGPLRARTHFPALRDGLVAGATFDADSQDIATPTAIEAYLAALLARGAEMMVGVRIESIVRQASDWTISTDHGAFATELVVDAAGAWADEVADLAGVPRTGLIAYRRTACSFDSHDGTDVSAWPLLMDADEGYYIKPETHSFMASPADETVQSPGEAVPHPDAVASALERVRRMTTLDPGTPRSSWAGLRTFAPDRAPVLGPQPTVPGFAWYAGLGGWGIMTAPAAARSVVSLIDHGELPADVSAHGLTPADVLPDRLMAGA